MRRSLLGPKFNTYVLVLICYMRSAYTSKLAHPTALAEDDELGSCPDIFVIIVDAVPCARSSESFGRESTRCAYVH